MDHTQIRSVVSSIIVVSQIKKVRLKAEPFYVPVIFKVILCCACSVNVCIGPDFYNVFIPSRGEKHLYSSKGSCNAFLIKTPALK